MQKLSFIGTFRASRAVAAVSSFVLLALGLPVCTAQSGGRGELIRKTLAEQPHWMEPLVTPTGLLRQEVRIDGYGEAGAHGFQHVSFGSGVAAILPHHLEIAGGGGYNARDRYGNLFQASPWFTIKDRLVTANEDHGNYVVTAFLGVTTPSEGPSAIFTPGLAFGKGWRNLDLQGDVAVDWLVHGHNGWRVPVRSNVALQYHMLRYLWPELELNMTWHPLGDGERGVSEYLTPGMMAGSFQVWRNVKLDAGAGYQIALDRYPIERHGVVATTIVHF